MSFLSTRAKQNEVSSAEAIVNGLSKDGGLFVPKEFPTITLDELKQMIDSSYEERVACVLNKFMPDFSYDELLDYATKAYSRFYGEDPCPLVNIGDGTYMLELWHGPTCAFKDMALTILPHLMTAARAKVGETARTLILVATSGDTGKAALEGFKDVENCDIIVFYPSEGVSDMQKMQMQTQEGDNVYVCAIEGNFDDAQNAVKAIFADKEMGDWLLTKGYKLSSANSINWGRLAPQIAYYVSSYVDMLSSGDITAGSKINFCVPSGNFGNILAGYYAKRMGVPIKNLICASNINNVLTDFFNTGEYNINRDFYKTMSPSMDILISSNLERLLFEIMGRDDKAIVEFMQALKTDGVYKIDKMTLRKACPEILAGYSEEEQTQEAMDNFFEVYDYVADPHTGVAIDVYSCYAQETGDNTPTVIVSTASPYKFPEDVYEALTGKMLEDAFLACKKLESYTGEAIPAPLKKLKEREVRFTDRVKKEDIKNAVIKYIESK